MDQTDQQTYRPNRPDKINDYRQRPQERERERERESKLMTTQEPPER